MVSRRSDSDLSKAQVHYDSTTGQVYSEAVVTAKSHPSSSAYRQLPRLKHGRPGTSTRGAPSLEHLAIHTLLEHVESLRPETLENLPWPVKKRIWKTGTAPGPPPLLYIPIPPSHTPKPTNILFSSSQDQQFHLWKMLVQSHPSSQPRDPDLAYWRTCKQNTAHEPLEPLPTYISTITDPTISFLTALTISKTAFPRRDLYQLAKLANLVALDVCAPADKEPIICSLDDMPRDNLCPIQPLFDDSVIRHFATHADVQFGFQSLRVLILRGFSDVTSSCLQHLNSFPRLSLFGVQNCGLGQSTSRLRDDEKYAKQHGWTVEDERGLFRQLKHEIEMSHTWDGMLRACVEMTADFSSGARDEGTIRDVPAVQDAAMSRAEEDDEEAPSMADSGISLSDHASTPAPPPSLARLFAPTKKDELHTWRATVQKQDEARKRLQDGDARDADIEYTPTPRDDPPLLNFKIGPTCSDLIFSTPMVFFRCLHGHIEEAERSEEIQRSEEGPRSERHKQTARQEKKVLSPQKPKISQDPSGTRSMSKNRRISGPNNERAAKRPKVRAGRSVQLTEWFELQGVGRRLSSIELEKPPRRA